MMIISIVVAVGENGVIGRDGSLPWHIPGDLKLFKQITMGKPIIMGRKTWESLERQLPGRPHVVITRDKNYVATKAQVVHDPVTINPCLNGLKIQPGFARVACVIRVHRMILALV